MAEMFYKTLWGFHASFPGVSPDENSPIYFRTLTKLFRTHKMHLIPQRVLIYQDFQKRK